MKRFPGACLLVAVMAATSWPSGTKIRSGQVDFTEGIEGNVTVSGDVTSGGAVQSETLSVAGQAVIGGRATVGDSGDTLTRAEGAASFNAWIGSATEPQWLFDSTNYTASPNGQLYLKTGMLVLSAGPGTRLAEIAVHGVFADAETANQMRARVYKQSIGSPGTPVPLTSESVRDGGASGPFSITLAPDYVVEDGYVVVIVVQMKNMYANGTRLFGIEATYHETKY